MALPTTATQPKKEGTFITGGGIKNPLQTDEDMTEEALLKQYDELVAKDINFGLEGRKNKKKKKSHYDLADDLLEDLDQHERDMNDMFKYLEEAQEMLRNKEDIQSIESMIEVTKDTMTQHFDAYAQFKG